jgi:hypothetical protein
MSFNEYHYKRIIGFLQALNKCLPDAIIMNTCSDIIDEEALQHNEHPLTMQLLNAIIETVCKIDYIINHNKSEHIVKHPLLFVSREDIEIGLELIQFLK